MTLQTAVGTEKHLKSSIYKLHRSFHIACMEIKNDIVVIFFILSAIHEVQNELRTSAFKLTWIRSQ